MILPDISSRTTPNNDFFKAVFRPMVQVMREVPVHLDRVRRPGRGQPILVLMPAYGRHGAALLRIYNLVGGLRQAGWHVIVLPWRLSLEQRRRILASVSPDLILMQGARHVLNRPALYPGHDVMFDMDDADFHLPHLKAPVERAMREVRGVMAGSEYIADWCRRAGARQVDIAWTGAPVSTARRVPQAVRPPVIAWAQTRPMTYTREAALLRAVLQRVLRLRPDTVVRLFDRQPGDDPGFAESFRFGGGRVEWVSARSYSGYLRLLDDVAVGVAPLAPETPFSRGKSFGKILGYLDRHVPVVASRTGEPARFFTPETGILAKSVEDWCDALIRLLDDSAARADMAEAAFHAFQAQLSTAAASRRVDHLLRAVIAG